MRIFCMSYNLQMKRLMVGHHSKRGRANEVSRLNFTVSLCIVVSLFISHWLEVDRKGGDPHLQITK